MPLVDFVLSQPVPMTNFLRHNATAHLDLGKQEVFFIKALLRFRLRASRKHRNRAPKRVKEIACGVSQRRLMNI